MKKEMIEMFCPRCGMKQVPVDNFEHMVVMDRGQALFTYSCPSCDGKLSALQAIPENLNTYVDARLSELSKKYPGSNFVRFCSDETLRNEEAHIDKFRAELGQTFGVDDAIAFGRKKS